MSYYLKKYWKANLITVLIQICMYSTQASFVLITVQMSQAIMDLDFRDFVFWMLVNIAGWLVYLVLDSLRRIFMGRSVWKMNNAVRRDMAATLLQKDYQAYHAQDKGEYLSWFTTGIKEIESNAWESFFMFTSYLAQVLANMIVLAALHWSLLPVALISAAIMIIIPKLFEKNCNILARCAHKVRRTQSVV